MSDYSLESTSSALLGALEETRNKINWAEDVIQIYQVREQTT